ncbi:MAG: DUF6636 domain-containing protein [Mycobacterium sp.]
MTRHYTAAGAAAGAIIVAAGAVVATLGAATAHADIVGDFKSPTGDVYCQMALNNGTASVACEGGGPYTGPAPDCPHGNWGDRFYLTQGAVPIVACHTDTIRSNQAQAPVLFFGQTQSVGDITCDSELSGITCTDGSTGRFFSMSAAANTLG